jgi:hypothetical protein
MGAVDVKIAPTEQKENGMKSLSWKVLSSVLVLALAGLACATPNVDSLLNPLPRDDFSNSSGWGTGTDSQSSVEYANDGLQMIVYQPYFFTWSAPSRQSYEKIHIETSVKNESTDPQAFFGIICNEQGTTNSFYYVGISAEGYYAFIKAAVAQDDVYLKEGTSSVISDNASFMRLGLDCGNGGLTLYVNGQQMDSVSDSTYTSGMVGIFAASEDEQSGARVTFDDFVVTKLGE